MKNPEENEEFQFDALARKIGNRLASEQTSTKANGVVNELSADDVPSQVKGVPTSVILFYRDDCPFCRQVEPILADLAKDFESKIFFVKVDVGQAEHLVKANDVKGVPLVIAMKKGIEVARLEGAQSAEVYETWIESIHHGIRPMQIGSGGKSKLID